MKSSERRGGLLVPGLGLLVNESLQIVGFSDDDHPSDSIAASTLVAGVTIASVCGLGIRDVLHLNCILAAQVGHLVDVEVDTGVSCQMKVRPSPNPSRSDLFRLCQLAEQRKSLTTMASQTEMFTAHSQTQTRPQEAPIRAEGILLEQCRQLREDLHRSLSSCEQMRVFCEREKKYCERIILLDRTEAQQRMTIVMDSWSSRPQHDEHRLCDKRQHYPLPLGSVACESEELLGTAGTPRSSVEVVGIEVNRSTSRKCGETTSDREVQTSDLPGSSADKTASQDVYLTRHGVSLALLPAQDFSSARNAFLYAEKQQSTAASGLSQRCISLEAEVARLFLSLRAGSSPSALPPRVEHVVSSLRLGREIFPELLCNIFTADELKCLWKSWYSGTVSDFFDVYIEPLQRKGVGSGSLKLREFEVWLRDRPLLRQQQIICEEGIGLWIRRGLPFDVPVGV